MKAEESRGAPRASLFMIAAMEADGRRIAVRVRNLSATGAQLESAVTPPVGTAVRLRRGGLSVAGSVVWCTPGQCGLQFDDLIDISAWLPARPGARDQGEVDRMVAEARSGGGLRAEERAAAEERALRQALPARIAEELELVARTLADIGDELAGDPLLIVRHSTKLQNLDISGQVLNHLAGLLTAADPEGQLGRIGMDSLRRRLERKAL